MDLPTYTSIWRIEKRLYKLYDFRLPMPLPIGQITVFMAVSVPYVVLLQVLGLPFSHTLIWLYILPPGVMTWLVTRPVLEGKRLPELVKSQLRYLAEPRVWCRMAPLSERDVIVVTGRIWRPARTSRRSSSVASAEQASHLAPNRPAGAPSGGALATRAPSAWAPGPRPARAADPPPTWAPVAWPHRPGAAIPSRPGAAPSQRMVVPLPVGAAAVSSEPAASDLAQTEPDATQESSQRASSAPGSSPEVPDEALSSTAGSEPAAPAPRPLITVVGAGPALAAAPAVERAIAGPSARRGDGRSGRVTVVPGGHRPGKPDQLQRDRARAQLPISEPARIVVLGCTVGAGQTVTALLTAETLASLRADEVAVLDLNPGGASLARRALARPALSQAASLGPSRLSVLQPQSVADAELAGADLAGADPAGEIVPVPQPDPSHDAMTFGAASEQYAIVLADPSTAAVPRLLAIADQLVLVAPASAAAAGAISMTFEWLEAHGQAGLADEAVMVLNGVSRRSMAHVEQAERVVVGRCRAIVRVPWDDQLNSKTAQRSHQGAPGSSAHQHWAGLLSPATAAAYTALAGVLVAGLAERDPVQHDPVEIAEPAFLGRGRR